jgi:N-acetylglucosaminyl-diphospho-decaprenol L-rhamnosyltransferase
LEASVTLSVIIVSYNTKDLLRQCLVSLYERPRYLSWEVIVVDNHSQDGSAQMVQERFPQVRLLENKHNVGFARGTNLGMAAATGRYFLFLNSDTRVIGEALEKMVRFLEDHPKVAVAAPRLVYPDFSDQGVARTFPRPINAIFGRRSLLTRLFPRNSWARTYLVSREHHTQEPFEVDWVSGACLMVRKSAIEDVGPLDEGFWMYWEDADLCYRLKQQGWQVYCLPSAVVVHHESKSVAPKASSRSIIEFHKSVYRFYRKHYIKSPLEFMNILALVGLTARSLLLVGLQMVRKNLEAWKVYTYRGRGVGGN